MTSPALRSTADAARISGATARQIDWWVRHGIVSPTVRSRGSGFGHGWSDAEVDQLTVLAQVSKAIDRHDRIAIERVAQAAADHAGYDDVWVDLGHGVSLVVERPAAEAAA